MPKPKYNGLYRYVEFLVTKRENPLGQGFNFSLRGETQYYYINVPPHTTEPNPFQGRGWVYYEDKGYKPHLRVDREFHSTQSHVRRLRYLSYVHATEYFLVPTTKQILTAHYYFDQWGRLQLMQCKLVDQEYLPTLEEQQLLAERADFYGMQLLSLLDCRSNHISKLALDLEKLRDAMLSIAASNKVNEQKLNKLLEQHNQIVVVKASFQDSAKEIGVNLFISMLEHILKKSPPSNHATLSDVEQTTQESTTPISEGATPKAAGQPEQKKLTKAKAALKSTSIDELEQRADAIERILHRDVKDINADALQQYVNEYFNLPTELLLYDLAENKNALVGSTQKRLEGIWKKFQALPDPFKLLELALTKMTPNLEHVKVLYNSCGGNISISTYVKMLLGLIYTAELEDFNKSKAILDWLQENDPDFNFAVNAISSSYHRVREAGETQLISILARAYLAKNTNAFEALLSYGAHPSFPWILVDGHDIYAFDMMNVYSAPNARFYVETLVNYGAKIQEEHPKSYSISAQVVREAASRHDRNLLQVAAARRTLQSFAKLDSGFKVDTTARSKSTGKRESICALSEMTFHYTANTNYDYYRALAESSELASLLLCLADTSNRGSVEVEYVTNCKRSGFLRTETYEERAVIKLNNSGLSDPSNPSGVLAIFDIITDPNFTPLKISSAKRTRILVDVISLKAQNLSLDQRLATENTLKRMYRKAVTTDNLQIALYVTLAFNFLAALSAPFTDVKMQETFILNCAQAAKRSEALGNRYLERFRSQAGNLTPQNAQQFEWTIQRHFIQAFHFDVEAIRAAFASPYPETMTSPLIDACVKHQKGIISFIQTLAFTNDLKPTDLDTLRTQALTVKPWLNSGQSLGQQAASAFRYS